MVEVQHSLHGTRLHAPYNSLTGAGEEGRGGGDRFLLVLRPHCDHYRLGQLLGGVSRHVRQIGAGGDGRGRHLE